MKTNYKTILTLLMAVVASTLSVSMLHGQDDETEAAAERAIMKNGKLFIVDDEGNEQEVDTSNARSVAIQQSSKIVEQDGERVQVSGGTATIVDANGKRTVIEFETEGDGIGGIAIPGIDIPGIDMGIDIDGGVLDIHGGVLDDMGMPDAIGERLQLHLQELRERGPGWRGRAVPLQIQLDRGEMGKYMLGVECVPVPEALRMHLQMDENTALLIRSISPDSPAVEAGLEKHDILLFADDQSLATQKELTEAVDLAGEEDRSLTLTFIRRGEEQSAEITPTKRPVGQARRNPNIAIPRMPGIKPGIPRIQIQEMGPGVILPDDMNPQMDEMQDKIRAQIDAMRKLQKMRADMDEMRNEMKRIPGDK